MHQRAKWGMSEGGGVMIKKIKKEIIDSGN